MATQTYPGVSTGGNEQQHRTRLALAINHLLGGYINATGEVTLTPSAAATVVPDPLMHPARTVLFDPLTAHAATELAAGTMYVLAADRLPGSFTITHANAASTDRSFRYVLLG